MNLLIKNLKFLKMGIYVQNNNENQLFFESVLTIFKWDNSNCMIIRKVIICLLFIKNLGIEKQSGG